MTLKFRITTLLLSLVLILPLCACGLLAPKTAEPASEEETPFVPANAEELWNKIDAVMEEQTGYTGNHEVTATIYYSGMEYSIRQIGKSVTDRSDDKYRYLSDYEVTMTFEDTEETSRRMRAYFDGKMYHYEKEGDIEQKLSCAMTEEEFRDIDSSALLEDVDLMDCTRRDFSLQDGVWTAKFSGYTKKTVHNFFAYMELEEDELGADVEDMEITVVADGEFRCTSLSFVLFFDVDEDSTTKPVFTLSETYSDFDKTSFDPSVIAREEYAEVDDLRIIFDLPEAMKAVAGATEGEFTLDITQKAKVGEQEGENTEYDRVTYGKKNGSTYFDISSKLNGQDYTISYKNGKQSIQANGESYEESYPEEYARYYLERLIDSAKFQAITVTDVEKQAEGTYLMHCEKADLASYQPALEESGITLTGGSQEITVTMNGEKLQSMDSTVILVGYAVSGSQKLEVTCTVHTVVAVESATLPTA